MVTDGRVSLVSVPRHKPPTATRDMLDDQTRGSQSADYQGEFLEASVPISVRRRLTPLKQSMKETPEVAAFSTSFVCDIMATCCLASSSVKPDDLVDSRIRAFSASSFLPFLTSQYGDSGAKTIPEMYKEGPENTLL